MSLSVVTRRQFISGLLISGAAGAGGSLLSGCGRTANTPLLSVARNRKGDYSIRIFSGEVFQQFTLPIPARAHGISLHPLGQTAVCHDRRPGRRMYVVDLETRSLIHTLSAEDNRHFFGHGVFSPDGDWLYTTENNYESGHGVIGVYNTVTWKREAELSSHGVGCHQLCLHPDGKTLVVANGGILTHPETPRKKLNLDTMFPSLSYVDRQTGELLEEQRFGHHQLSIRHLDVSPDGTVVFGAQYQGEKTDIHPLVGMHRRGESVQAMNGSDEHWLSLGQYVASVACFPDNQTAVITSPRGNIVQFWDLASRSLLRRFPVRDVAGIAVTGVNSAIVSNGLGELISYQRVGDDVSETSRIHYPDTSWDNHMISA
ncbi:DUF1513 domain-containing protein [Parendozoicomonas haliclonae]|uniref:DUF1513 domain-containing protein n=1 Tax=Parendozoicomonas haliclonae TaxID=1960125 RepID=A0A1X7APT0_9GAMM|nr:DUF1513 domain-containing protein [Parendozoicomonas haliclonae]SMA50255.1 hypothetical protein EHSB41UT_04049 [Parendozoicomonas haliclonae]